MATQTNGTKWHEAYCVIKKKVLEGRYDPGERIEETKLAEALNMGRTPIREALRRLEGEGLLKAKRVNSRMHIHYLEEEDPKELLYRYEMREAIEGTAAGLAAKNMNGWQVDRLRELDRQVGKAFDSGDRAALHRAGMDFHEYLVANCGNPLLYSAFKSYHLMPPEPRSAALEDQLQARSHDAGESVAHEYTPVVDAISARDSEEAERYMKQVISRITEAVRTVLFDLSG